MGAETVNRTRVAILVALVALGIALGGYLFTLGCPFLGLFPCTPPQAALVYVIILPVGMSVAFVGLLVAFFTQHAG
ncbi:MAG: hypothetical protein ACE5IJ_06400 [Thermoplasmata archaeon]